MPFVILFICSFVLGFVPNLSLAYAADAVRTGKSIGRVANIVALKALDTSELVSGDSVRVLGFYSAGDGGLGSFVWAPADRSIESAGLTVAPLSGIGRWKRVYDPSKELSVLAVGAVPDGTTDNSSILSTAVCRSGVKFHFPSGSYLLNTVIRNTKTYYRPNHDGGSPQLMADPYTPMMLCQGASNFIWHFDSDAFLVLNPLEGHCRSSAVEFDRDHHFQLLDGPNIKGCRTGLGQVENVALLLTSDTNFVVDGVKCVEGFNGGACIAADWLANGIIRDVSAPNVSKAFDVAFLWKVTIEKSIGTGLNADGVSVGTNFLSLIFDYPNQYNNFSGLADRWPPALSSDIRIANNKANNFIAGLAFLTGENVSIQGNTLCDNPGRQTIAAQGRFPMLPAQAGYGVEISYHNGGTSFPSNGHAPHMFSFDGNKICRNGTAQKGGGILINAATIPAGGAESDMLGAFNFNSGNCSGNSDKCLQESGQSKIKAITIGPNWSTR